MPSEQPSVNPFQNAAIFAELPESALSELTMLARPVRLDAKQVLFVEGDPAAGCYAVVTGSLRVSRFSNEGHETVLTILGPGEVVGEMGLFGDAPRSATVTAMAPTDLRLLPKTEFLQFADQNPQLYRHFLRVMSARLRATNDSLTGYATLSLSGRLARVLVRLAESFGQPLDDGRILIRQRFTQTDLSSMAGSARENVSRQLAEWRREGMLSRISDYYCLDDPAAFRDLAHL